MSINCNDGIMSCEIVNEDTQDILTSRVLAAAAEPVDEFQQWPSTDITVGASDHAEAEAAHARIGKPSISPPPFLLPTPTF